MKMIILLLGTLGILFALFVVKLAKGKIPTTNLPRFRFRMPWKTLGFLAVLGIATLAYLKGWEGLIPKYFSGREEKEVTHKDRGVDYYDQKCQVILVTWTENNGPHETQLAFNKNGVWTGDIYTSYSFKVLRGTVSVNNVMWQTPILLSASRSGVVQFPEQRTPSMIVVCQ